MYRALDEYTWRKVEPTWITASQRATVTVSAAVKVHEYAVQVLDPSGNVSELRDYGNYYQIPLTQLLNVSKAVTPTQVYPNNLLTYTIVISNPDLGVANWVTMTDVLTAGLQLQACAATGIGLCQSVGNQITTTFASIAPRSQETVTIVTRLDAAVVGGTLITNRVEISSAHALDPVYYYSVVTTTVSNLAPAPTPAAPVNQPPVDPPPNESAVNSSAKPPPTWREGETGQIEFSFVSPSPGSDLGDVVIVIDLPATLLHRENSAIEPSDLARLAQPMLPFEVLSATYKVHQQGTTQAGNCRWQANAARVSCAIGDVVVPYRVEVVVTLNALRQGSYAIQAQMLVDDARRVVSGGSVTTNVTILARPLATPTPSAGQRRLFVPMVMVLPASRSLAD